MYSQKLFNKYNYGRHWENHPTIYAEEFADFLKDKKFSGKVVDVGCANGRDIHVFSNANFDALGIDYKEEEINIAQQNFPSLAFDVQNVERLSFPDNSVDAFFMINVVHYVDQIKALKEIFRALKPCGWFYIHFNLDIVDENGNNDYHQDKEEILNRVSNFLIVDKKIFNRVDLIPVKHTHTILGLILQKPVV